MALNVAQFYSNSVVYSLAAASLVSHHLLMLKCLWAVLTSVNVSLHPPVSTLQVYFKEASVKQVDVPTLTGAFGILPAHVPTLQVLRPGVVTVFSDDGSSVKYFGKIMLQKNKSK